MFQSQDFISAIGGAISAFTGFAIIMTFELVELMFDFIINTWKHFNPTLKWTQNNNLT